MASTHSLLAFLVTTAAFAFLPARVCAAAYSMAGPGRAGQKGKGRRGDQKGQKAVC